MTQSTELKGLVDRPFVNNIKNFDRMVVELGKYMNELEMDNCIEFMMTVSDSKWDINPTIEDSKTQLKIILGSERYDEIVGRWKQDNQKILSSFGTLKYKNKLDRNDKTLYDGLDPTDNPEDWEKVYV